MHDFQYLAPLKLADAIEQLAKGNGDAKPLAGGTDLIDQMQVGRFSPSLLVDLKKIPELNVLAVDGDGLHVGAAVPCYRISGHEGILDDYTALADSCQIIGGIQIQSRASIGGNLCNSGPAADSTPSMIALSGSCVIAGPSGTREVPVESFCTGPGQNVLEAGEMLVEVKFPPRQGNSGSHYRRMIPRNEMDIAMVGVGASVQLDDAGENFVAARISLCAVAPTPLLAEDAGAALVGQSVTEETIAKAAEAAQAIVSPITDMRGTRDYRIHATGVLVRRTIQMAAARARGEKVEYHPAL